MFVEGNCKIVLHIVAKIVLQAFGQAVNTSTINFEMVTIAIFMLLQVSSHLYFDVIVSDRINDLTCDFVSGGSELDAILGCQDRFVRVIHVCSGFIVIALFEQ